MRPEISGETTDDLRETLTAAFDGESNDISADSGDVPADTVAAPEDRAEKPAETKSVEIKDETRDEKGRFKAKSEEIAAEASPAVKQKKEDAGTIKAAAPEQKLPSKDEQAKASAAATQPTDAPPAGWTAEAKAEWSNLSPALKAAVLKREVEIANGGRQWSEEKRRYEAALAPVAQASQRYGIQPEEGLQRLLAANDFLERDPVNAIKHLAVQYGVNLANLAGNQPADDQRDNGSQGQVDIQSIVSRAVNQAVAPLQQRFAADEQQREQGIVSLVTEFASSPEHEHFNAVQNELMAMIPTIKSANPSWTHQQILQDAYDRAVYANPQTRAAILADQAAKADTVRKAEAQARAGKARNAASSVTGAPTGNGADTSDRSLREEIMAAAAG